MYDRPGRAQYCGPFLLFPFLTRTLIRSASSGPHHSLCVPSPADAFMHPSVNNRFYIHVSCTSPHSCLALLAWSFH